MPSTDEIRAHAREAEDMIVMGGHDPDGLARQCAKLARYARLLCDEVEAFRRADARPTVANWSRARAAATAREDAP